MGVEVVLTPRKYVGLGGNIACLDPLKCHILSLKTVVGQLCKPHNMKDERLVSKMEGKTNFSRHVKQFDGLARLTPPPDFTTDLRPWCILQINNFIRHLFNTIIKGDCYFI